MVKNDSLISVIVPVYKVEEYLDECLQSLISQTYTNLEIILVDDGSPDKCPHMCDEWAKKDNRIRVIHKANGGLSSARNVGLENAIGDFVSFVDSDDFFDAKMYEKLYEGVTRSPNIGISAIKFYKFENGNISIFNANWDSGNDVYVKAEDFGILTLKQEICHAATNKLYRRDLLKKVRFREGRLNEDTLFANDLSKEVIRLNVGMWDLNYYAYYYRMRQGSICHSCTPIDMAYFENLQTIVDESEKGEYHDTALRLLLRSVYDFCRELLVYNTPVQRELYNKFFGECRRKLRGVSYKDITDRDLDSSRFKYGFWLVKYCPFLYRAIYLRLAKGSYD
jgi:glycosyltransferase involved in cell wall biosynthesis